MIIDKNEKTFNRNGGSLLITGLLIKNYTEGMWTAYQIKFVYIYT